MPGEVLDVTDAAENVTAQIDLKDYLPDGVILAEDDFSGMVSVTAYIEQQKEKEITLKVKDIALNNMPQGFQGEITDPEETYTVTLVGLAADLDAVNEREIGALVDVAAWMTDHDMEEMTTGYHDMPVEIVIDNDRISLKQEVQVRVHVTEE